VYFGGEYAYEKPLIKWLSNAILYLHSGFENFCKCYNETRKATHNNLDYNEGSLSPTRMQDFWFLYTKSTELRIPFSW
jgi:hypothetical protein